MNNSCKIAKRQSLFVGYGMVLVCMFIQSPLYSIPLSFTPLFPMTWYEKGLHATSGIWHNLCAIVDKHDGDYLEEHYDILLGRCIFTQFCFEKMHHTKQHVFDEDSAYVIDLLSKIEKSLRDNHALFVQCQDQRECLIGMVVHIKQLLQVPRDF